MTDSANYEFLPWVRTGFRPNVQTDNLEGGVSMPGEVTVAVSIVGKGAGPENRATATTSLRLYGPGDVTGIDERQVVSTEPKTTTITNFPPNYFPTVEFDRPDLPWLFTPAAPAVNDRLRPWISLVVVPDQDGVTIDRQRQPRPVLTIEPPANPARELPDPTESWAWAHAQAVGNRTQVADDDWIRGQLGDATPTAVSRLVAPRRLDAGEHYLACVVPTFDAGVAAGLGRTPEGGEIKPAWSDETSRIELPVYFDWEFSTSSAGDFEALVRRLEPAELSADVGYRPLDVSDPGPERLAADSLVMSLGGALRSTTERDESYPQHLRDAVDDILDAPSVLGEAAGVPIIGPPIYGRWHAASRTVPDSGEDPVWLADLNLDPRTRVAAGLGTAVVQDEQEALMTDAWKQVGQIRDANRLLARAQLARGASARLHASLANAEVDAFDQLLFTWGVHARLRFGDRTVAAHLDDRRLPNAALSPAFRRIARPNGPLARRLTRGDRTHDTTETLRRLNDGDLSGGPSGEPPDGMKPIDEDLSRTLCALINERLDETEVDAGPILRGVEEWEHIHEKADDYLGYVGRRLDADDFDVENELDSLSELCDRAMDIDWEIRQEIGDDHPAYRIVQDLGGRYETVAGRLFSLSEHVADGRRDEALATHAEIIGLCADAETTLVRLRSMVESRGDPVATHLESRLCESPSTGPEPSPVDVSAVAEGVISELDPETTVPRRALDRIDAPWNLRDRPDPLATVMAAPEFPQPMYEPLAERSQEHLLPGIEYVPADSVSLAETNPEFIVAYLVGCNHELGRELLWREYPTDQRGSYFRQFWDVRGRVPPATTVAEREARKDVDYLHRWPPKSRLRGLLRGDHSGSNLVLLVRGELLKRYPDSRVYAVKATRKEDDPEKRVPLESPEEGNTDQIRRPLFRGELDPDVTFFGFGLTEDDAYRDDDGLGWFFVIEEPPAEPRFGLDEAEVAHFGGRPDGVLPGGEPEPPDTNPDETPWGGLSWGHLVNAQGEAGWSELAGLNYVSVDGRQQDEGWHADGIEWGRNSAHLASATWQRPARVAIHADDMLPGDSQ